MFNYRLLLWLFPIFPLTQMCCSQEVTGEEKMEQTHPDSFFFWSVFLRAPVLDNSWLSKFNNVQHTAVTQQYICDRSERPVWPHHSR